MASVFSKAVLEARRQGISEYSEEKINFKWEWVVDPTKLQVMMMKAFFKVLSLFVFSSYSFSESSWKTHSPQTRTETLKEEVMESRWQATPWREQVKDPRGGGGGEALDSCLENGPSMWKQGVEGPRAVAPSRQRGWWSAQHGSDMSRGTRFCQNV